MRHARSKFPQNPRKFELIKHLESILIFSGREELRTFRRKWKASIIIVNDFSDCCVSKIMQSALNKLKIACAALLAGVL